MWTYLVRVTLLNVLVILQVTAGGRHIYVMNVLSHRKGTVPLDGGTLDRGSR